ncbi:hypothetical protein CDL15_Pgr019332 [Punica granatum]|uniref:Uncharacterized protein n=1 Tax=Punica granatum TaxID=22663 RepID=A0A218X5V0_PUNGR|nr:hypothetical protein CDL15_Pgr019332 [Punica granatum]
MKAVKEGIFGVNVCVEQYIGVMGFSWKVKNGCTGRRWLRRERQLTVTMWPRAKGRWVITAVVAREAARLVAKAQSGVAGLGSMQKARASGGR